MNAEDPGPGPQPAGRPTPGGTLGFGLRRAQPWDGGAILRLWHRLDEVHAKIRPDFFTAPRATPRTLADVQRILADPQARLLVAVAGNNKPCALIGLRIYETPPTPLYAPRRRAYVEDLVVDDAWQRRGIGRALMAAGEAWARKRQASQLVLTVWEGNLGAEGFYEALGYGQVNRVLAREL